MFRKAYPLFLVLLAACGAPATGPAPEIPQRLSPPTGEIPPMKVFAASPGSAPRQSNGALARDFLELSFYMESGRPLPRFTRFEGPVSVRLTGVAAPESVGHDLDGLIGRLRSEARIDIRRVPADQPASITVEVITRSQLKRVVPDAACFVVPNTTGWKDFLSKRRSAVLDWARLERRTTAAVFLPGDVSPQEVRDCLNEEIAQALGPVNDLYRLPQSVFNDDNIYPVLTGFDMLMLRATYDSALRSGMTKAEVANRLPGILARVNPRGGNQNVAAPMMTPRAWVDAIETAIGPNTPNRRRVAAAERALAIAQSQNWTDPRMGYSLFVLGRVVQPEDANLALASLFRAAALYGKSDQTALQSARVGMQLAAFALSSGDSEAALSIVNRHLKTAETSQDAALLSSFLFMKYEALNDLGRPREALAAYREGLAWGRYGFGSIYVVRQRAKEIASIAAAPSAQGPAT